MKHSLLLLLFALTCCHAFPVASQADKEKNAKLAEEYLKKYYNLKTDGSRRSRMKNSGPYTQKISEMQRFFGLEVTGKLDAATLDVMQQPRCGVSDVKEFSTFPGRPLWKNKDLTYKIVNYTIDMPKEYIDLAILNAFKVWSDVTPLTFARVNDSVADIEISFAEKDHNDFYLFDGTGHTLEHAFVPGNNIEDAHFEDDKQRYSFMIAHQVGHSLGLSHSSDSNALMYPNYPHYMDHPKQLLLSLDDVRAIQSLYGAKQKPVEP